VIHSNAIAYAYALVQLEESRLLKTSSRLARTDLAVSLAVNKNQLLNRITRIMEKSVRTYSGREKIIPVLLLVAGLLCASWISIQSRPEKMKDPQQNKISSADTTIKKHNKRAIRSPKKPPTPEPDAVREIEISEDEEFDVVEAPEPFVYIPVEIEIPPFPEMEDLIPPISPIHPIDVDINLAMDTIPFMKWGPNRDWEKFSEEFESKFKEQFGCKTKEKVIIQKAMKIQDKAMLQQKIIKVQDESMVRQKAMKTQDMAMLQQKIIKIQDESMVRQKAMKIALDKQFQYMEKQHEDMGKKLKSMEENVGRFEKALHEQLIHDGYLKSDEKINSMHWSNEGIEINDIKIKESDLPRYQELHDKYFYIK
jgi:bla regulator protein BlaR1